MSEIDAKIFRKTLYLKFSFATISIKSNFHKVHLHLASAKPLFSRARLKRGREIRTLKTFIRMMENKGQSQKKN